MEVYNINMSIPTTDRISAVQQFMVDTIAPYLTRYDNVSYLSEYKDEREYKILFDIGFDNIAFGFRFERGALAFQSVLSKKTDIDNANTLYTQASGANQISLGSNSLIFNCTLRIISRDNKLIAINLGKAGIASEWWLVLDTDNYGKKYLMIGNYSNVYYDGDDSCTKYQLYNANSAAANPMEGIVLESLMYIYSANTGIIGLSSNIKSMINVNLPTTRGSTIDVAGVKYVAMTMNDATAHNNVWVYDKEYQ